MYLHLICVGRLKAGPERELAAHYLGRAGAIGKSLGVSAIDMREIEESKARRPQDRKSEEAKAIRAQLANLSTSPTPFIVCEAAGENLSSSGFAQWLSKARESGNAHLSCIIGGPDGLAADLCAQALLRLAFGAMTWPHQLARIMAAEQIYRALTLIAGHPYHRD